MKKIVLAATAAFGMAAIAAPAQAALFQWNVDYTGYFADGASITGFFTADETAATDGFVSTEEFDSWAWNWSGNSEVAAASISSADGGEIQTFFGPGGFFVDGTANVPGDSASEGVYAGGNSVFDLDFLTVEDNSSATFSVATSADLTTGTVAVADPIAVPEPATVLGLLTLAGAAAVVKRQKQAV